MRHLLSVLTLYVVSFVYSTRLLHISDEGNAVEMDLFLRQCLRQFPFLQSALLKQLVATLAKIEPVSEICMAHTIIILSTG